MVTRLGLAVLLFALTSAWAQADIYRCQIDGVIVFADAPCQPDAAKYQPDRSISVVEAPSNLDEITAANQALIQHRRALQAERAASARAQVSMTRPQQPKREEFVHARRVHGLPLHLDRRPRHRDRNNRDRNTPVIEDRREPRFSALSGRLPGTRRREPVERER